MRGVVAGKTLVFQSTLPVRGATRISRSRWTKTFYFNPRSPCGERRELPDTSQQNNFAFQSTLPVRGATEEPQVPSMPGRISIHAPRAGSDR